MADILNATIADNGHLILVLADGSTIDAGQTRGIPGPQGERGVGVKLDRRRALELYGEACDLKAEQGCKNYAILKNQGF